MEHRLILEPDGFKYLAFARGRVAALRRLGFEFITETKEVDGFTIRVKIIGENEYIYISGAPQPLEMDSGIVDIGNTAPGNAATYLPGTLYENSLAEAYNAPFTVGDDGYRTNPNPGSAGQLSGSVYKRGKNFKGKVPTDVQDARSFSPKKIPVTPATVPPTWENDPADENLALKKQVAVLCPASIFTGKCRLWIQAVYGQFTYKYKPDGGTVKTTAFVPTIESTTSAAPALWFHSYLSAAEVAAQTEVPDVLVDTSTGVWLDPATGKHWMTKPINGELRVYPLIGNASAQALRKHLITIDPPSGAIPLSDIDREHLEAYILASCRPHVSAMQLASGSTDVGGNFSMGYGWHWNWTGNVADIVKNNFYDQGDNHYGMESTHYRIAITMEALDVSGLPPGAPAQQWSVALTAVEGPTKWAVYRSTWCFAEPNYATFEYDKMTPKISYVDFTASAPVYAFYIRDELKVCRAETTYHPPGTPYRDMTYGMAGSYTYQAADIQYLTVGTQGGFIEESNDSGWSYKLQVSCGGVETPQVHYGLVNVGARTDVGAKELSSWSARFSSSQYSPDVPFQTGYPPWAIEVYTYSNITTYSGLYTYTFDTKTFTDTTVGNITVIVPFYDAEAIYIQADTRNTRNEVGDRKNMSANVQGFNWGTRWNLQISPGGALVDVYKYDYDESGPGGGSAIVSQSVIDETQVTETELQKLVCRAGTMDATFTQFSSFHDNELDSVQAGYYTLSGTSVTSPTVIAPGHIDPVGANGAPESPIALVGWI